MGPRLAAEHHRMTYDLTKLDRLENRLTQGPCSTKTLLEVSGYKNSTVLANALQCLDNVKRGRIDAGCRMVTVYWIDGVHDPAVTARRVVPAIQALRRCENKTVKEAMRELGIEQNPDTVWKAIRDYELEHGLREQPFPRRPDRSLMVVNGSGPKKEGLG